jgi:hypothetical protein
MAQILSHSRRTMFASSGPVSFAETLAIYAQADGEIGLSCNGTVSLMKCRRKPIVHEYYPVERILSKWLDQDHPEWIMAAINNGALAFTNVGPLRLMVKTTEGSLVAPDDGYIIQGVYGEIWPIRAKAFAATYEVVGA